MVVEKIVISRCFGHIHVVKFRSLWDILRTLPRVVWVNTQVKGSFSSGTLTYDCTRHVFITITFHLLTTSYLLLTTYYLLLTTYFYYYHDYSLLLLLVPTTGTTFTTLTTWYVLLLTA